MEAFSESGGVVVRGKRAMKERIREAHRVFESYME